MLLSITQQGKKFLAQSQGFKAKAKKAWR